MALINLKKSNKNIGIKELVTNQNEQLSSPEKEFNRFFKNHSLASTYKPTFVKCLLDIRDCTNEEGKEWVKFEDKTYTVDLNFIVARFLRYYHPLRFKHKLKQNKNDKNGIVIFGILDQYQNLLGVKSAPSLKKFCSSSFSEIREKTRKSNAIQKQVMPKLLNDCKIYDYDDKNIFIKKEIVDYMANNKSVLLSALNNMISIYLEKANKLVPNISKKLLLEIPRKRLSKEIFEKIILLQDSCCFYCKKKSNRFEQEHFIPWNYVTETEIYNIVAACEKCNKGKNGKSDNLPENNFYADLLKRNEKLEKLPIEYNPSFIETIYNNCRTEYHGINEKLWTPS